MRYTPATRDLLHLMSRDVGRPLRDIKLKFEDPTLLDDMVTVLDKLTDCEQEVRSEDGRWYVRRILPYRTLDDVIDGVVISFSDITELRAARATAEYNEKQLRLLADALPAVVAYFDRNIRYVLASAAHTDWFDVDLDELPGRSFESLLGAEHYDRVSAYFRRALLGERVTYQDQLEHRQLGLRKLDITLVPNVSEDEPLGVYLLATDITNVERRAEADHANRSASMNEMAATIAHQLNQPLSAISSYAGALKHMLDPTDHVKSLEIIKKLAQQTQAAGAILHELREAVDRRDGDRVKVDFNRLIHRLLSLTEGRIKRVGAEVSLSLAADLPLILGSRVQLEQLLINLVVNALEAMQNSPTRQLGIRTHYARGYLRVQVTDTGPGIDPEDLGRVFDAFYTSKQDSMGMGLAISRSIAEEYGGNLRVECPESGGASFTVRLPVDQN